MRAVMGQKGGNNSQKQRSLGGTEREGQAKGPYIPP